MKMSTLSFDLAQPALGAVINEPDASAAPLAAIDVRPSDADGRTRPEIPSNSQELTLVAANSDPNALSADSGRGVLVSLIAWAVGQLAGFTEAERAALTAIITTTPSLDPADRADDDAI